MSELRLSVVVPAYNEEARLPGSLEALLDYYDRQPYSYEVIIVSDGSTDGTSEVARRASENHPNLKLIEYKQNRGKGHAVRLGMLEAAGELVLFCDADLATPQEETEKLLGHMADGADVAIGSRPLRESRLEIHQPIHRELLGRAFNKLVQLLAIRGIQDTQCGFKMFTAGAARAIFRRCKLEGFSFDFESLMIARDLGFRIDEVPIRWHHVEGSKVVLLRDGPRMLLDLLKLRIKGKGSRLKET